MLTLAVETVNAMKDHSLIVRIGDLRLPPPNKARFPNALNSQYVRPPSLDHAIPGFRPVRWPKHYLFPLRSFCQMRKGLRTPFRSVQALAEFRTRSAGV